MSDQLNLFSTITCSHCQQAVGFDPRNPILWNGFADTDTKQNVCRACATTHYRLKSQTKFKNMYSEMPVPL